MSQMRVALFAATEVSHFTGVLAIARELADIGAAVRIWTDKRFRGQIIAADIEFGDLFEHGTVNQADPSSFPRVARVLAFSVQHCEAIARTVADWRSDVVFVEGHTLIGQLIAERLSQPWVLINAGHLPNGPALRKLIREDFPTQISDQCIQAVKRLRTEFGHEDASPDSYISLPSPWVNIHLEPPQWLIPGFDDLPRRVECFGSHLAITEATETDRSDFRIYAAFGTIVWRYWTKEALSFLEPLADAVERLSYSLTIGLGGAALSDDDMKRLSRDCVTVLPYADQINELRSHDLFFTHNGMNSTHEAVMLKVPMMSCPFVNDEPDLARLCVDFGISRRVTDKAIGGNAPPTAEYFAEKISTMRTDREAISANLSRAYEWEIETISRRKPMLGGILRRF